MYHIEQLVDQWHTVNQKLILHIEHQIRQAKEMYTQPIVSKKNYIPQNNSFSTHLVTNYKISRVILKIKDDFVRTAMKNMPKKRKNLSKHNEEA